MVLWDFISRCRYPHRGEGYDDYVAADEAHGPSQDGTWYCLWFREVSALRLPLFASGSN
jgi:hypothetical protein